MPPPLNGKSTDCELGGKLSSPYRLAITGKSWAVIKEHAPEMIPKIAVKGAVFARMSSDQKQQLIEELQQIGYYVGKNLSTINYGVILFSLFHKIVRK